MNLSDLFKKKIKIATHNGSFHADEVFAIATLLLWADKNDFRLEITRTRDESVLDKADIVLDVGGIYDSEKKRFDHHQKEGAGTHDNNVPYASFGLIWKHYAEEICSREVAEDIEKRLVIPIDARDNGQSISNPNELGIVDHKTAQLIHNFNPTKEEGFANLQSQFDKAVEIAKEVIKREIAWADAEEKGEEKVQEEFIKQGEPEILIIDKEIEWERAVAKIKKIKWVIKPDRHSSNWKIKSARDDFESYTNRSFFPESWRGLRDKELQEVSGIKEAIFCHRGGFLAVAKSKSSALEMAHTSLKNNNYTR